MVLHLSGEIGYETLDNLVKAFNSLKKDELLQIYFTVPEGGLVDVATAVTDFINKNKEFIEIIFYGGLYSAGMRIFLSVQCKKDILPDTVGMYHFYWQEMHINETGKPDNEGDLFVMKEMRKTKIKNIEFLKTTNLNDKEIAAVKKGKDVYFSHERMLELIKKDGEKYK